MVDEYQLLAKAHNISLLSDITKSDIRNTFRIDGGMSEPWMRQDTPHTVESWRSWELSMYK